MSIQPTSPNCVEKIKGLALVLLAPSSIYDYARLDVIETVRTCHRLRNVAEYRNLAVILNISPQMIQEHEERQTPFRSEQFDWCCDTSFWTHRLTKYMTRLKGHSFEPEDIRDFVAGVAGCPTLSTDPYTRTVVLSFFALDMIHPIFRR